MIRLETQALAINISVWNVGIHRKFELQLTRVLLFDALEVGNGLADHS